MATTKKTETKTETKETKTAAKTAEKKTATKKAAAKPAAKKTAAKKPAAKKAAPAKKTTTKKAATKVDVFVEFGGVQVSIDEVIKNVKLTNGKSAKDITVYIKPEESKAYFVADGEEKEM
ncbi:MAG: hypothetical protein J1E41_02705, partial [Ruminococcus sp.]|nr:hypothetical protein [Ruminococcus sp.]